MKVNQKDLVSKRSIPANKDIPPNWYDMKNRLANIEPTNVKEPLSGPDADPARSYGSRNDVLK